MMKTNVCIYFGLYSFIISFPLMNYALKKITLFAKHKCYKDTLYTHTYKL